MDADTITLSDRDVDDELYGRVTRHFDQAALIELTAASAWENASSKFNRAFRVGSQNLWQQEESARGGPRPDPSAKSSQERLRNSLPTRRRR